MLDIRIMNHFDEAKDGDLAIDSLTKYSSVISAIKEIIVTKTGGKSFDELSKETEDFNSRVYAVNDVMSKGDQLVYEIYVGKDVEETGAEEEPFKITGVYVAVKILHLSIALDDSLVFESENYMAQPPELRFVQY